MCSDRIVVQVSIHDIRISPQLAAPSHAPGPTGYVPTMTPEPPALDQPGARVLSTGAHALRNHVATIRSVVRLVDDPEVAEALDEASASLQLALERAIVLSRVELGERPGSARLELGALVALAERRARREGAHVDAATAIDATGAGTAIDVPGPWAERLVADLLHHADGGVSYASTADEAVVEIPLRAPPSAPLDGALVALASACGGSLVLQRSIAVLRLPRAAGVSAG